MKRPSLVCFVPALLAGFSAQAQSRVAFGPHVGVNLSTQHYVLTGILPQGSYRPGLEAGGQAAYGTGHWSGQAALLYSQQGHRVPDAAFDYLRARNLPNRPGFTYATRLHYLTLPVALVYAPRATGQGPQVFVGAYLAGLLGGSYVLDAPAPNPRETGTIRPVFGDGPNDGGAYARRVDAGLRGGLGYRAGAYLAQASYSRGLRSAEAIAYRVNYANEGFQLALTYFLGPKG